jgi:hypothetical protein
MVRRNEFLIYIYVCMYIDYTLHLIRVYVHASVVTRLGKVGHSFARGELLLRDVSRKRFAVIMNEHVVSEHGV